MRTTILLLLLGLVLLAARPAYADVKVCPLFADNAVLQQRKPIAVWGTAEPGEIVVVRLQNVCTNTIADKQGHWLTHLPAFEAGGPYELTIKGKNRLVAHNVYVGEVWLCAGQSNMAIPVSYAHHTNDDIKNSANPELHFFKVGEQLSQTPVDNLLGKWQLADPDSVRDFSAVGYYFGRAIQAQTNVHVGIICSALHQTPIKVWMGPEPLQAAHANTQVILPDNFVQVLEEYEKKVSEWHVAVADARAKGLDEPIKPVLPSNFFAISAAFYGMIQPMIPYSLRGVCWYQGESDTDYPEKWRTMFACMVDDWRLRWQDAKLPFIYVQLPAFDKLAEKPTESLWAQLRESQLLARRIPYAYMACTIDTCQGEIVDLHPREKKEVADRLAQVAFGCVYKKPVAYSGPLYDSMQVEGNKIRLNFRYADGGLQAKNGPLRGFSIAGVDKNFVTAQAKIDGNSVLVWSDKVSEPVAVRFGWAANPGINLFNKANLPASPFRTDKWASRNKKLI